MDRFSEKQTQIKRRRVEASACYPALWAKIISEWKTPGADDRVWLTYSANYLFRTNGVRWAIDPLTLNWRVKNVPQVDAARDLRDLSFVLLTHRHADHLDLDLLSALRDLPITWVVPDFMQAMVINGAGLRRENIVIPSVLQPFEINGIRILPFNGVHWETTATETRKGVPALGYLIECGGRRWLFPGDTRTYEVSQLPAFPPVDILFAHFWLGCSCALMDEPPLLDAFYYFCRSLSPSRLILAHLNEFGREAEDFWDESHIQMFNSKFKEKLENILVLPFLMGESITL